MSMSVFKWLRNDGRLLGVSKHSFRNTVDFTAAVHFVHHATCTVKQEKRKIYSSVL